MKHTTKILMAGVAALIAATAPARADGVKLGLGGVFMGYGLYNNQEEPAGASYRSFDLRKESEIWFKGETTLDNGLTVGVVVETNTDRAENAADNTVEESYAYLSGGWGRFNIGETLESAALLQVTAPAADENIDGFLPDINSFDLGQLVGANTGLASDALTYIHLADGRMNKVTYLTPYFSGFQAGFSYVPSVSEGDQDGLAAITSDNTNNQFDDSYSLAARYEGSFEELDYKLGAGWTIQNGENSTQEDLKVWNIGGRVNWGPFGIGVSYMENNNGVTNSNGRTETFVAGADYVTGPYRFGVSYYDRDDDRFAGTHTTAGDLETSRWTGGVVYTYGPGMTVRGSLAYVSAETSVAGDVERDGYQFALGTQINF